MGHNNSKEERFKKMRISTAQKKKNKTGKVENSDRNKTSEDGGTPCTPLTGTAQKDITDDAVVNSARAEVPPKVVTTVDTIVDSDAYRHHIEKRCSRTNSTNQVLLNNSPKSSPSCDYLQMRYLKTTNGHGGETMDRNNNPVFSNSKYSCSLEGQATSSTEVESCYIYGNEDAALRRVMERSSSSSVSVRPISRMWQNTMLQNNNMAVYNFQATKLGASKNSIYTSKSDGVEADSLDMKREIQPRMNVKTENKKGAKGKSAAVKGKESNSSQEVKKSGCCKPVAPPVFIEAFNRSSGGDNFGGRNSCCNPTDRLKNVDVVEELLYYVPTPENCNNANSEGEFDYYYVNDCGEVELMQCPPKESSKNSCSFNPVKYSRRQRFNFKDNRDADEPPFPWLGPQSKTCCCQCCRAGLRRNPKCCCPCCEVKGSARASNSFDEIPVGKNPQIQAKNFDAPCSANSAENSAGSSSEESSESCEDLLPIESGLYFYDANRQRFVRQEPPLTPEPLCVTNVEPPPPPPPPPKKKKPAIQPVIQQVVMQPPCPPPPPPPCCPSKKCCCKNDCSCKTPPPPNFVPIMMCGGYNGGLGRCPPCPPRFCGPRPPYCMPPPPCMRPCYPNPYQCRPQQIVPSQRNSNASKHSNNIADGTEDNSYDNDSEELPPTSSGSSNKDITASVTRQGNSTITTINVPPGREGDVNITA